MDGSPPWLPSPGIWGRGRGWGPDPRTEVDVIGLNRRLKNLPAFLGTLLFDRGLAILSNGDAQHGFAPLWAPDQMVDDKVDAVFISLIIHVDIILHNDILINRNVLRHRLKPWKAPDLRGSILEACGGLKPVSVIMVIKFR